MIKRYAFYTVLCISRLALSSTQSLLHSQDEEKITATCLFTVSGSMYSQATGTGSLTPLLPASWAHLITQAHPPTKKEIDKLWSPYDNTFNKARTNIIEAIQNTHKTLQLIKEFTLWHWHAWTLILPSKTRLHSCNHTLKLLCNSCILVSEVSTLSQRRENALEETLQWMKDTLAQQTYSRASALSITPTLLEGSIRITRSRIRKSDGSTSTPLTQPQNSRSILHKMEETTKKCIDSISTLSLDLNLEIIITISPLSVCHTFLLSQLQTHANQLAQKMLQTPYCSPAFFQDFISKFSSCQNPDDAPTALCLLSQALFEEKEAVTSICENMLGIFYLIQHNSSPLNSSILSLVNQVSDSPSSAHVLKHIKAVLVLTRLAPDLSTPSIFQRFGLPTESSLHHVFSQIVQPFGRISASRILGIISPSTLLYENNFNDKRPNFASAIHDELSSLGVSQHTLNVVLPIYQHHNRLQEYFAYMKEHTTPHTNVTAESVDPPPAPLKRMPLPITIHLPANEEDMKSFHESLYCILTDLLTDTQNSCKLLQTHIGLQNKPQHSIHISIQDLAAMHNAACASPAHISNALLTVIKAIVMLHHRTMPLDLFLFEAHHSTKKAPPGPNDFYILIYSIEAALDQTYKMQYKIYSEKSPEIYSSLSTFVSQITSRPLNQASNDWFATIISHFFPHITAPCQQTPPLAISPEDILAAEPQSELTSQIAAHLLSQHANITGKSYPKKLLQPPHKGPIFLEGTLTSIISRWIQVPFKYGSIYHLLPFINSFLTRPLSLQEVSSEEAVMSRTYDTFDFLLTHPEKASAIATFPLLGEFLFCAHTLSSTSFSLSPLRSNLLQHSQGLLPNTVYSLRQAIQVAHILHIISEDPHQTCQKFNESIRKRAQQMSFSSMHYLMFQQLSVIKPSSEIIKWHILHNSLAPQKRFNHLTQKLHAQQSPDHACLVTSILPSEQPSLLQSLITSLPVMPTTCTSQDFCKTCHPFQQSGLVKSSDSILGKRCSLKDEDTSPEKRQHLHSKERL